MTLRPAVLHVGDVIIYVVVRPEGNPPARRRAGGLQDEPLEQTRQAAHPGVRRHRHLLLAVPHLGAGEEGDVLDDDPGVDAALLRHTHLVGAHHHVHGTVAKGDDLRVRVQLGYRVDHSFERHVTRDVSVDCVLEHDDRG